MPPTTEQQRYSAIDNLRAWMMLLLIPFHAAIPFITIPAPHGFNDPDKGVFFDGVVLFLVSFRRPVFFLVGGLFAAMMLDRRGVRGMLKNRFQRILLPLVLGWIVLAPLTRAAYKFAAASSQQGTIEAGWRKLADWSWLRWSNPYHLWFLIALLLFYALALAFRWLLPRVLGARVAACDAATRRFLASPWRPLLFAGIAGLGFIPSEFCRQDRGNVYLALAQAVFFGLGWLMYRHIDLLEAQAKHCVKYCIAGLLLLPLATWTKWHCMHPSDDFFAWHFASGLAFSLMASFMVFGVLGVFVAHVNGKSARMRYLSDSSYWIYLAHMPVVVFAGGVMATTHWPGIVNFLAANAITIPIVLVTYHGCVRYTPIGTLLNGPREKPRSAGAQGGAATAESAT